jgi:hypothetical protein
VAKRATDQRSTFLLCSSAVLLRERKLNRLPRPVTILAAAALLLALGEVVWSAGAATAATGDGRICRFEGPSSLVVGKAGLYVWRVQDNREDVGDTDRFALSIDNAGSARAGITGVADENTSDGTAGFARDDLKTFGPTNIVRNVDVASPAEIDQNLRDHLKSRYGYVLSVNPCGATPSSVLIACISDGLCPDLRASTTQRTAWSNAVAKAMTNGETDCSVIANKGNIALIVAGYSDATGRDQIETYWNNVCSSTAAGHSVGPVMDSAGFVLITCTRAGTFQLSLADQGPGSSDVASIKVTCKAR